MKKFGFLLVNLIVLFTSPIWIFPLVLYFVFDTGMKEGWLKLTQTGMWSL